MPRERQEEHCPVHPGNLNNQLAERPIHAERRSFWTHLVLDLCHHDRLATHHQGDRGNLAER